MDKLKAYIQADYTEPEDTKSERLTILDGLLEFHILGSPLILSGIISICTGEAIPILKSTKQILTVAMIELIIFLGILTLLMYFRRKEISKGE